MSEARRLQFSLVASLLINAAALLAVSWFWHFQPRPAAVPRPRLKLVRVALLPKPPVPRPIPRVKPVPPPVPKPHRVKPRPLPKRRRPGAHVKSPSPAPPAKAAGGSDAGAAGPQIAAAPPIQVIAQKKAAPRLVQNPLTPRTPLKISSLTPGGHHCANADGGSFQGRSQVRAHWEQTLPAGGKARAKAREPAAGLGPGAAKTPGSRSASVRDWQATAGRAMWCMCWTSPAA